MDTSELKSFIDENAEELNKIIAEKGVKRGEFTWFSILRDKGTWDFYGERFDLIPLGRVGWKIYYKAFKVNEKEDITFYKKIIVHDQTALMKLLAIKALLKGKVLFIGSEIQKKAYSDLTILEPMDMENGHRSKQKTRLYDATKMDATKVVVE